MNTLKHIFVFFAGLFSTLTMFSLYQMYSSYKMKRVMEKQVEDAAQEIKGLARMPSIKVNEQGMFCLICLTNASNVISVPCNHLSMCHECFSMMKS